MFVAEIKMGGLVDGIAHGNVKSNYYLISTTKLNLEPRSIALELIITLYDHLE
jgi:hypothetical protein